MKRLNLIILILLFVACAAWAAEDDSGVEVMVITPNRYPSDVSDVPASVSVITGKDIQESNADNVVGLLQGESGVHVRDAFGNGSKASVDMSGFGETADSNTLVLVDGRRVNSIDLSGIDWTLIPLDAIERIEIMRGGSGSVLYGDNAQGGVINIITKKGKGKPKLDIETKGGSYRMNKQHATLSGASNKLSYFLDVSRFFTDGYRKNSFLDTKDYSARTSYDFNDTVSLDVSSSYHNGDFGFPGALSGSQLASRGRRFSKNPDDHAGESDWYVSGVPKINLKGLGDLEVNFSFRGRDVDTTWASNAYKNSSNIDTLGVNPKYILEKQIFGHKNKFMLGFDFYKVNSKQNDFSLIDVKTDYSNIDKLSMARYFQNEFSILDNLFLTGGYRYEDARYSFNAVDFQGFYTPIDDLKKIRKEVYRGGVSFNYKKDSKLFVNISKSMRFPAVDEFVVYDFSAFPGPAVRTINPNLQPQTSQNYEIGIEHRFNDHLKANLTVYRMDVDDEIFFNPLTFNNENYDKTRHAGIDFSSDIKINNQICLFGNYSYTSARFRGGDFNNKKIPAVPRNKATFGIRANPLDKLTLNAMLNFVGSQYLISDQSNIAPKLKSYVTVDCKASYKWKQANIYLGINNIFDEMYSEQGVYSAFSGENFYPSPGRNVEAGIAVEF